MTDKSTVTITTHEGVFVFTGAGPDKGRAQWSFLNRQRNGQLRLGRPPARFGKNSKHKRKTR